MAWVSDIQASVKGVGFGSGEGVGSGVGVGVGTGVSVGSGVGVNVGAGVETAQAASSTAGAEAGSIAVPAAESASCTPLSGAAAQPLNNRQASMAAITFNFTGIFAPREKKAPRDSRCFCCSGSYSSTLKPANRSAREVVVLLTGGSS